MVIRRLALVALLLTASPVFAEETPSTTSWHRDGAAHHKFAARIAEIEAKLNLTAAQKPLWDNLVTVIKDNMRSRIRHRRAMAAAPPQDAPTRLDVRLEMLKEEIRGVDREKAALAPLWSALDASQRDTLSKAIAWHARRGKLGHHPDNSSE